MATRQLKVILRSSPNILVYDGDIQVISGIASNGVMPEVSVYALDTSNVVHELGDLSTGYLHVKIPKLIAIWTELDTANASTESPVLPTINVVTSSVISPIAGVK